MKIYTSKLFILFNLFISFSVVTVAFSSQTKSSALEEEEQTSTQIGISNPSQQDSSQQISLSQNPQEPSLKKRRTKTSSKDSSHSENVDEKGEANIDHNESSSAKPLPKIAKEIGEWVGSSEEGIKNLNLTYKKNIIDCEEILNWHVERGKQMQEIKVAIGSQEGANRNPLMARVDFIYKEKEGETYKSSGIEIPAVFLSGGNYKQEDDSEFGTIREAIWGVTREPVIPINAFIGWDNPTDEERHKLIKELLAKWKVNSEGILDPDFIKKEGNYISEAEDPPADKDTSAMFGSLLHSEEAFLLYVLGHTFELAKKQDGEEEETGKGKEKGESENKESLLTFSEYLKKIDLPKDIEPKLCLISMVSKYDSCSHCRPVLTSISNSSEFLKNLNEPLKTHFQEKQIVLFYSALQELRIKRPNSDEFAQKTELERDENHPIFLMATNPQKE